MENIWNIDKNLLQKIKLIFIIDNNNYSYYTNNALLINIYYLYFKLFNFKNFNELL